MKCPLSGFKPCDPECAWHYLGQCAMLNVAENMDGIKNMRARKERWE